MRSTIKVRVQLVRHSHLPTFESMVSLFPFKFLIPDLVSHCPFPLRSNRHRASTSSASKSWLFRGLTGLPFLSASTSTATTTSTATSTSSSSRLTERLGAFHGLKAGKLTALCYPTAGAPQLRVCCDFMNYLFHLDNISDAMDVRGTQRTADVVMDALTPPGKGQGQGGGLKSGSGSGAAEVRLSKMTRE
jgi:hypothetical protein